MGLGGGADRPEQQHIADRIYKSYPFVGLVFGTHYLHRFPELLYESLFTGKRVFEYIVF